MGWVKDLSAALKKHQEEEAKREVVKAPEFDLTHFAKRAALAIPVFAAACGTVLKELDIVDPSDAIVIAIFGVVAAALLGASLVMAADLAARAFVTGVGEAKKEQDGAAETDPPADSEVVAAPPGTTAWLENDDEPHPLLAIKTAGEEASSYLLAVGSTVTRPQGGQERVEAIDGTPKWHPAEAIRAIRPAKWP
jgi:hypothetical protein